MLAQEWTRLHEQRARLRHLAGLRRKHEDRQQDGQRRGIGNTMLGHCFSYSTAGIKIDSCNKPNRSAVAEIFFIHKLKPRQSTGHIFVHQYITRGQSNLTKSASRGSHSPVRGHHRGSKVALLNSWGRVSIVTVWPQCTRVTTNDQPTNQPTTNDVTTQPISISASFTNVKWCA